MQATSKELYEQASEKLDVPFEHVKWVGDVIFREWAQNLKEPEAVILRIKRLGRMYLRKNRLMNEIVRLGTEIRHSREDLGEDHFLSLENKRDLLNLYEDRMIEYNNYIKKRKEKLDIRRLTQKLLERSEDEPY